MKKLLYHKLVRDKIPEIIKASGKPYSIRHLSDQDLTRYSLKKLRELGFKTFYPYIDESYDEEPDELKRFNMVMEQVNKLCSMELPELHDLYWSMSDILIHNHDVYYKTVIDKSKSKIEYIVDYIMR